MKKLLTAAFITIACITACNDGNKTATPTTETDNPKSASEADRAKEISDSTKMLDKKLANPNSTYSPDSLK